MRPPSRPAVLTTGITLLLAGTAALLVLRAPDGAVFELQYTGGSGRLTVTVALAVTFLLTEQFLLNIEFRRQAHSITLATVPLLLAVLVLPVPAGVLARAAASTAALAWQRVAPQKLLYNVASYAAEAAVDASVVRLVLGRIDRITPLTCLVVIGVLGAVDLLVSLLVQLIIRIHGGRLTIVEARDVLLTGALISIVSCALGFAALLLVHEGIVGLAIALVVAAIAAIGYRVLAATRRRHESLALVHEFVADSVGAESVEALAGDLLARIRTVLRAGGVELLLLDRGADADGLALRVDEDDRLEVRRRGVDPTDWTTLRVLTSGEALIAARDGKDTAVRHWLDERGFRDALLVPVRGAAGTGASGLVTVTDRLSDLDTFTVEDRTLLQTLTAHLAVAVRSARLVERLAYDATHDALTGLANRSRLSERIAEVLAVADAAPAVLLLDLNRFKEVNDALGHAVGDQLLTAVAQRLSECAPAGATVARLGGDEFAVLVPDLAVAAADRDAAALRVAERIAVRLAQPLSVEEALLTPEASIGVAIAGADGHGDLLRQADTAMYSAKGSDAGVALYRPEMDRGRVERLALLADLRTALASRPEEFAVHFQPKIDLAGGAAVGAEALVRWNHPLLGVVGPDRFIGPAETTGLISELTRLVLDQSLAACARWRAAGWDGSVAVNLSARNVSDPQLPGRIAAALATAGVPADRLTIEITESTVMGDPDQVLPVLQAIDALGVCLSLDDFGTGYSSLSYLQRLPVHEVKIDRSFVRGLTSGDATDVTNSRALIRSITGLGATLGLRVVAEGIEQAHVLDELAELGCHIGQGYLISRPLPAEAFAQWIATRTSRPTVVPMVPLSA